MASKTPELRKRRSKYIHKQRHLASCGPIAVANMIKWAGIETSYKKVLEFCRGVRAYDDRKGMYPFQMRYVLRTLRVKFKVKRKFSVEDLTKLLSEGGACIFVYETKAGTGHVVFIDKIVEGGFRAWNRMKGHPPFFSDEAMRITIERSLKHRQLYVYTFQGVKR